MQQKNIQMLGKNDVLIASYPGAGSTWFASIFINLSIFYVEGYHEQLIDNHSLKTTVFENTRRQHLPILDQRDVHSPSYRESFRIIKTHMPPTPFRDFLNGTHSKVVLLVRDGRDTVLSYYHWLRAFENYQSSLLEFLRDFGRRGAPLDWANYYQTWLEALPSDSIHVITFEKCRSDPSQEILKLLEFLCIERKMAEIEHAIESSSYSRMRKLESDEIRNKGGEIGHGRIMRKGKVGGWVDEFGNIELETFQGIPNETLKSFGYYVADEHTEFI